METADHQKPAGTPLALQRTKKDLEGISQKVLTDSLLSLESDRVITRTVYPEVPPRVEYALNELGETFKPILDSMAEWGRSYQSNAREKYFRKL